MKVFKPPTLDFELWDDEKATKYSVKRITRDVLNKIKSVPVDDDDMIYLQCSLFLGGKKEDFYTYDIRVLSSVLKEITASIENPTEQS